MARRIFFSFLGRLSTAIPGDILYYTGVHISVIFLGSTLGEKEGSYICWVYLHGKETVWPRRWRRSFFDSLAIPLCIGIGVGHGRRLLTWLAYLSTLVFFLIWRLNLSLLCLIFLVLMMCDCVITCYFDL